MKMQVSGFAWLIVAACLGLPGSAWAGEPALKTSGDLVAEAKREISEVEPAILATETETLIIDVSEPDEYAAGHLPGAINVPRGKLEFRIGDLKPLDRLTDEERRAYPIVLYCSYGGRGSLAAKTLQDMGYANVRSLRGGLLAWKSQDLPLESGGD